MGRGLIIVIISIAIVLLGSGIFIYLNINQSDKNVTQTSDTSVILNQFSTKVKQEIEECNLQLQNNPNSNCHLNLAKELKDVNICNTINDDKKQQFCYTEIVLITGDEDICKKISMPQLKDSCFKNVALVNLDPLLCFELTGENYFMSYPEQKTNWQSSLRCINSCDKESISVEGVSFSVEDVTHNLQGSRQYYEFTCYESCKESSQFPQFKCYEDVLNRIEGELK